jgi:hypothetical protein
MPFTALSNSADQGECKLSDPPQAHALRQNGSGDAPLYRLTLWMRRFASRRPFLIDEIPI